MAAAARRGQWWSREMQQRREANQWRYSKWSLRTLGVGRGVNVCKINVAAPCVARPNITADYLLLKVSISATSAGNMGACSETTNSSRRVFQSYLLSLISVVFPADRERCIRRQAGAQWGRMGCVGGCKLGKWRVSHRNPPVTDTENAQSHRR